MCADRGVLQKINIQFTRNINRKKEQKNIIIKKTHRASEWNKKIVNLEFSSSSSFALCHNIRFHFSIISGNSSASGAIFRLLRGELTHSSPTNNNWFKVRRYTFDSAAERKEGREEAAAESVWIYFFYLFVHSTTTNSKRRWFSSLTLTNVRHLTTAQEKKERRRKCSISLKFMYSFDRKYLYFSSFALMLCSALPSIFDFLRPFPELVFLHVCARARARKLNSFVRC